jgi:hypothetical protein
LNESASEGQMKNEAEVNDERERERKQKQTTTSWVECTCFEFYCCNSELITGLTLNRQERNVINFEINAIKLQSMKQSNRSAVDKSGWSFAMELGQQIIKQTIN